MPAPARNDLRFVAVGQDDPLAEPLLAELAVEYAARYGSTVERIGAWLRGYPPTEFEPPGGGMVIGLVDGQPATGGAFRRFDAETAELKRIWTDGTQRRRGLARALLAELESQIASLGYRKVYLTTGDRQPEAEALYLATGYRRLAEPLPAEGEVYPVAFEKDLPAMTQSLNVAIALEGYGWHPDAWRHTPDRQPVLSGRYWTGLATAAERGAIDFITFDDGLTPQRRRRPEIDPRWLAGRPDAVMVAARVAPVTSHIGLVPVATVTHTEPFHVSKAIATLDFVSAGRAGWQPRVSGTDHEAALFGRRKDIAGDDLFAEAVDFVEVVRQLWDSWEDDAVIRDVATGRYLNRDKLHYIDFDGDRFSVKGPSITPRPPQGQPVVAVLAHSRPVYEFAARSADVVFITPKDDDSLRGILGEVTQAGGGQLKVYADVFVTSTGLADPRSDAVVFDGAAAELVDMTLRWQASGLAGIRLRPSVIAVDLPFIVDEVLPLLREVGAVHPGYRDGETLRGRLGLPVAKNRYAGVGPR